MNGGCEIRGGPRCESTTAQSTRTKSKSMIKTPQLNILLLQIYELDALECGYRSILLLIYLVALVVVYARVSC